MIIAVDIRYEEEDYRNYIYQIFGRLTKQHPKDSFLFMLEEQANDDSLISSQNIIPVVIKRAKLPLLSQVITDNKVAAILKKHKVEVFVTPTLLSKTNILQCLIFNNKIPVKAIKKVSRIISTSASSKKNIITKYKVEPGKIDVVYPGIDGTFHPVEIFEREKTKEQSAEGNEYFLFKEENASLEDLLNLLRAFTLFKKRQKSNMQLLIASNHELNPSFLQQLNLYKYKNDVKVFNSIAKGELVNITAGAYAAIYFYSTTGFYFSALEGFKSAVPVIINNVDVCNEICGDAALYINPADNKDIGEKMMLIFKDEKLRSGLINKGQQQVKKFSWDIAAERLWQSIEKAAK